MNREQLDAMVRRIDDVTAEAPTSSLGDGLAQRGVAPNELPLAPKLGPSQEDPFKERVVNLNDCLEGSRKQGDPLTAAELKAALGGEFVAHTAPRILTCKTSGRRWAVPSFDELPGVDLTPRPWWRRLLDRIRRRPR